MGLLSSSSTPWILDSGASDHMTGDLSLLSDIIYPKSSTFVTIANGTKTCVKGIGTIHISGLTFSSVLYLPQFPFNLLSIRKITRDFNCSVTFSSSSCVFQDLQTKRTIGGGYEKDGLYFFQESPPLALHSTASPFQWHCRLGHPSSANLRQIVPSLPNFSTFNCETCELSKHRRVSFPLRNNPPCVKPFELIHSDIWGPSRTTGLCGSKYFVTFIDDYSRLTWVFILKNRSQLFDVFKIFYAEICQQFNAHLLTFRSDNAQEYKDHNFNQFFASHGIIHQTSCVTTPQQNGIAERKNGPVLAIARGLMIQMNVPKTFWSDAILTATFLLN